MCVVVKVFKILLFSVFDAHCNTKYVVVNIILKLYVLRRISFVARCNARA